MTFRPFWVRTRSTRLIPVEKYFLVFEINFLVIKFDFFFLERLICIKGKNIYKSHTSCDTRRKEKKQLRPKDKKQRNYTELNALLFGYRAKSQLFSLKQRYCLG